MSRQKLSLLSAIFLAIVTFASGLWVLTAIPIGFLVGFFLERADSRRRAVARETGR